MTVSLIFMDALLDSLLSQFGFGVLSLILGLFIWIIFSGYYDLDVVYSLALAGIPFTMYIINIGNQFFWLLGVIVIFYGIILFSAFRGLLRG